MHWIANIIISISAVGLLIIGGYLALLEKTASAAAALGFAFLLVVLLLLAKFKRFKGFGFEAEMWEEKQIEAAALVDQLTLLSETVGRHGQTLEKTREELDQQKKALDQQNEELDRRKAEQDVANKLFLGTAALNQHAVPSDIDRGKNSLAEMLHTNKNNRRASMLLARLFYEKEDDVDSSIKVLDDFLYNNPLLSTPERNCIGGPE